MKKLLVLALFCLCAGIFSQAASAQTTLNLSDCSQSSLNTEWNLMSSGAYVLQFPSCAAGATGTWTSGLTEAIPSGVTSVTIQGNTAVSCTGTPGTSSFSCSYTDETVIQDAAQNNNPILILNTGSNASTYLRITGLTVEGGSVGSTNNTKYSGIFQVYGYSNNFRVDHCHFSDLTYSPSGTEAHFFRLFNGLEGVMDHNLTDMGTYGSGLVSYYNGINDTDGYGDGTWQNPTAWGSSQFMFLETNDFENPNGGVGGGPTDCANAGRFVFRYNTMNSMALPMVTHPTNDDAGGRARGCRAWEYYHNYVASSIGEVDASIFDMSGTGLVWDNTVASGYYRLISFITSREAGNYPPSPYGITWGQCGNNHNGQNTEVPSNWDGNSVTATGYPCLDGQGRGQTQQQIAGSSPLNQSTGTVAWPQQYLEPSYMWENANNSAYGTLYETGAGDTVTTVNRDFYPDNSSFTGTNGGTGWGTLASRPSSCTAGPGGTFGQSPTGSYGVGYFATDANSGAGELYICTATNTWTAVYSPYTYPHPLVSGGGGGGGSVTLSPALQSYGSVNVGAASSPATFTVINNSASGMTSFTQTISGANAGDYSISNNTCGSSLGAGNSCTLQVTFTAGAVGSRTATLTAAYAGGDGAGQQTASLSGTGVQQNCLNTPLGGNWTCVSDATNYTSSSGTSLTAGPFSVNPPAGSLIVVFQFNGSNAPCVVPTDTMGTSFTGISSATVAADSMQICDWYGVVGASAADAVTCRATATASSMGCSVVNVTGQSSGTIMDQSCTRSNALSASGINNMTCSNSITVGLPNELVVAAGFGDYGTRSAGTNFTMIDANNWSGEYFMEATPMIWTPSQTISASGLNYGFLAVTLEPHNLVQPPSDLSATVTP